MNGLLVHLPQMLALSASSPFWRGEPTGLASSRQMVFAAFPRSGPPPRFKDYADYAEVVGHLERTGCIADYTHIWWDIRPHPRLGTIEMRVCDAVTRLEDVVAITAFFQAIVKMYCELYEPGKEVPSWHRMLTTENKWLAARYGLEAPVMDLATGRRNRVPVAQLIRRTLRDVEPHARELGSERELEGVREILARGNGADRQLRVWNANRDIVEVVREISTATEAAAEAAAADSAQPTRLRTCAHAQSVLPSGESRAPSGLAATGAGHRARLRVDEPDVLGLGDGDPLAVGRERAPCRRAAAPVPGRIGTRPRPGAPARRSRRPARNRG